MHKCVRCGSIFQDNDSSILRGCVTCGSIFFLYIKNQQQAREIQKIQEELEAKETTLEEELTKHIEKKKAEVEKEKGKILAGEEKVERKAKKKIKKPKFGIETIRIIREGVYEINLDALMKKKPLIIFEKGKVYFIHLPSVFETIKTRR
jgi:predicted  nucleic acid-binding Zn-ribbon protein